MSSGRITAYRPDLPSRSKAAFVWFLCDDGDDTFAHALEPLTGGLDAAINAFHSYWPDPDRAVSAATRLSLSG